MNEFALKSFISFSLQTETKVFGDNGTVIGSVTTCNFWWIKDYTPHYAKPSCEAPTEFAMLAVVSLCLTLINIFIIIITGFIVNKVSAAYSASPL